MWKLLFKELKASMLVVNEVPMYAIHSIRDELFNKISHELVPVIQEASEKGRIVLIRPNFVKFGKGDYFNGSTKFDLTVEVDTVREGV